jgi:hypothetical protein
MTDGAIPTEEFSREWENYGDANPEPHGGKFVRWDPDLGCWEVVVTVPWARITASADADDDRQHVTTYQFYPDDVFEGGDPANGFTEGMQRILRSLHESGGLAGASPEPDSPRFFERAAYYVADLTHYHGQSGYRTGDPYPEILDSHGIDPDEHC